MLETLPRRLHISIHSGSIIKLLGGGRPCCAVETKNSQYLYFVVGSDFVNIDLDCKRFLRHSG